jgi:hypothetical protein
LDRPYFAAVDEIKQALGFNIFLHFFPIPLHVSFPERLVKRMEAGAQLDNLFQQFCHNYLREDLL